MRKIALAAGLLLGLAAPALAGTITFTVTTAAGTVTKTFTDTDANIGLIVSTYAPNCAAQNLAAPSALQPGVPTACTSAQTMTWWFNSLISGTVANVRNAATAAAAASAAAAAMPMINPQ